MERWLTKRRSVILAVIGIGAALALAMFVGGQGSDPICSGEGSIGSGGVIYGQDPSQECAFVDEQGDLIRQ